MNALVEVSGVTMEERSEAQAQKEAAQAQRGRQHPGQPVQGRRIAHRQRAGCRSKRPLSRTFKRIQIEPLSDRELDVLRLLGTDLDGPEIARELTVSLNTVRTHTKNLYSKLGVNNRRAAVKRAEELQLLSRTRKH